MRIVVAMSGGVDSSLAAALLAEAGHEVTGVTLQLRPCAEQLDSRSCCGSGGLASAREVAGHLGLAHYVLPCHQQFEDQILRPAWAAYDQGLSPSPCLWCNERIKFGYLLSWARRMGAQAIATGHYARILPGADGRPALLRGRDPAKDQAYFLARLPPKGLERVLLPLGDLTKQEVRVLALQRSLPAATRADSQDACLLSDDASFPEMLRRRFAGQARPGQILDDEGRPRGQHQGLHNFTVGQRHGLGVALGKPAWVRRLDDDGTVHLTTDPQRLLTRVFTVRDLTWLRAPAPDLGPLEVQVRHRHRAVACHLEALDQGRARITVPQGADAVAPGQAAVFFQGDLVLGSGWIEPQGAPHD